MSDDKKKERLSRPSQVMPSNKSRSQPNAPPENTYRLAPPRLYNRWKVEPLLQYMLREALQGEKYNHENIKTISKELTQSVKHRLMVFNYKRYKIVVTLIIGQNSRGGGINIASRAIMHMEFDGYASANLESNDIFATMIVFFLNYE